MNGWQTEWWLHRDGCRAWFLAERHTTTNEIRSTWLPGRERGPHDPAAATPGVAGEPGIRGHGVNERLPARDGESIRRDRTVRITLDGRRIEAFEGDTIGSALAAAGVDITARSFKYHRPRGSRA